MKTKSSRFSVIVLCLIFGLALASACQTHIGNKATRPGLTEAFSSETLNLPTDIFKETPKILPTLTAAKVTVLPQVSLIPTEDIEKAAGHVSPTPDTDLIWKMIGQVNQERVLADLRRLTGIDPICTVNGCHTIINRETGSQGLQWAKDYVDEELTKVGYSVERQNWSRSGFTDQNLIARKQGVGHPEQEIYFIAHLDGYLDNNPAADDDASGAVSLLELARILSSRFFSRTVVLIFSTGEEHGTLGSHSYVDQLTPEQLSSIKYLVSVEMLGYDSNNDGVMELWSGNQPTDFVLMLSKIISDYQLGLTPEIVTGCT